jgi:hypothetical protein
MKRSQLFLIGTVLLLGLLLSVYSPASPRAHPFPETLGIQPERTIILSYTFEKPGLFLYGTFIPGYHIAGPKRTMMITIVNEMEYPDEHHQ